MNACLPVNIISLSPNIGKYRLEQEIVYHSTPHVKVYGFTEYIPTWFFGNIFDFDVKRLEKNANATKCAPAKFAKNSNHNQFYCELPCLNRSVYKQIIFN